MGSQKLAKGGNKFIWNPLAFCIFTLKRDKTYSKTLKWNDFQFQSTKKCSIQKVFEHFIFFFPLIKNHQWLGRRKRQPFLCKRAIIAMASNLKPPWFKVYHCISYVFFVFSFFLYTICTKFLETILNDDKIHAYVTLSTNHYEITLVQQKLNKEKI